MAGGRARLSDWVIEVVRSLGPLGVGLMMLLENIFPPIPSELIMPLAGYIASRDGMPFWAAVFVGSAGSLAGTAAWYWFASRISEQRLRNWIDRHGRWLGADCDDLDRARDWFNRHGRKTVLLCRLVPGIRTWISVPAGLNRMPIASFLLYTSIGTFLWTWLLAYAGYMLGRRYEQLAAYLGPASTLVLILVAVLYLGHILRRNRRRRRDQ